MMMYALFVIYFTILKILIHLSCVPDAYKKVKINYEPFFFVLDTKDTVIEA